MSNILELENLGNTLQIGPNGEFSSSTRSSERKAMREMEKNGLEAPGLDSADSSNGQVGFGEILKDSIEKVNLHQHQADEAIKNLIAGRTKNIHETMLAVERADTSLKMMMQVRNKIIDAYREVMRMQV